MRDSTTPYFREADHDIFVSCCKLEFNLRWSVALVKSERVLNSDFNFDYTWYLWDCSLSVYMSSIWVQTSEQLGEIAPLVRDYHTDAFQVMLVRIQHFLAVMTDSREVITVSSKRYRSNKEVCAQYITKKMRIRLTNPSSDSYWSISGFGRRRVVLWIIASWASSMSLLSTRAYLRLKQSLFVEVHVSYLVSDCK